MGYSRGNIHQRLEVLHNIMTFSDSVDKLMMDSDLREIVKLVIGGEVKFYLVISSLKM